MKIGRLDRTIHIQERVAQQDAIYGTYAPGDWVHVCTLRADVQDMLPSRAERIAEGIDLSRRPCRVRTHWRAGITTAMRVIYGTRTLQIVSGPAELGRREGMEFICEEFTTEGEAP